MNEKCPACGGLPYLAFGYNVNTKNYDVPETCAHACPTRADAGDCALCLCCKECMDEGRNCRERRTG